jgi:hypothetical protein
MSYYDNNIQIDDHNSDVYGSNCIVRGNGCTIYGSNCKIYGENSTIYGSNCIAYQRVNENYGSNCIFKNGVNENYGSNCVGESKEDYGSNNLENKSSLKELLLSNLSNLITISDTVYGSNIQSNGDDSNYYNSTNECSVVSGNNSYKISDLQDYTDTVGSNLSINNDVVTFNGVRINEEEFNKWLDEKKDR